MQFDFMVLIVVTWHASRMGLVEDIYRKFLGGILDVSAVFVLLPHILRGGFFFTRTGLSVIPDSGTYMGANKWRFNA